MQTEFIFEKKPPTRTREEEHLHHMRICWPQWEGPQMDGTVNQWIECNGAGRNYMAPCKIIEIGEGKFPRIKAMVHYYPEAPQHCLDYNGTILDLSFTEIWVPVRMLNLLGRGHTWEDVNTLPTDH
jgi:hypothetical protein